VFMLHMFMKINTFKRKGKLDANDQEEDPELESHDRAPVPWKSVRQ